MRAGRLHPILGLIATVLLLTSAAAQPARAQDRNLEAAVKATFVMRFASFVQWPTGSFPNPTQPVVICVVGDPNFAQLVEAAAQGERIGARALSVRHFSTVPNNEGCHVLYAARDVSETLSAVRGQSVLTVTDDQRSRTRGMIHFVVESGRVRFHIDRDATDAANLAVNSRLLSVAASVRSRRGS